MCGCARRSEFSRVSRGICETLTVGQSSRIDRPIKHLSDRDGCTDRDICSEDSSSDHREAIMKRTSPKHMAAILVGLSLGAVGLTGCQVTVGGQTLPSPYYLHDDVQYFAPGSEFKLARENAAQKAYASEQAAQGKGVR